jgi:primosomal protein N' (replication factor Y)
VLALVALPHSAPDPLLYRIPEELEGFAAPGVRVRVPLRDRELTGIVVEVPAESDLDPAVIRPVLEVLDPAPLLPDELLGLARFITDYYRCPLGATLAAMLPARLLRADGEVAALTPAGVGADPAGVGAAGAAILAALLAGGATRVPALLAKAGCRDRRPLDELVGLGLVDLRRQRRDRPPATEVTAVQITDRPLAELLEDCRRAPRQREVLQWLADTGRPALLTELRAAVGCSPATVRALLERGALVSFTQPAPRPPRWALRDSPEQLRLTDEQQASLTAIAAALAAGGYAPFLLEGVTGSGKTEVYLRCLELVLARGGSGLVLVPEIGLTPAAAGAVERRFGGRAAVVHSAQSEGERWREWRRAADGETRVVVGPRSALFTPLSGLQLIVVDEEHDSAYKQAESPRYHARDLALVLGKRLEIPVVLCSATPSVEAAALVRRGLATLLRLTRRVAGGSLPQVEVVDLRGEPPEPGEHGHTWLSRRLREAIDETLAAGDQIILLMQRRGWAPLLLCRDCGARVECPSCSVSMVVHRRSADLRCHYCGHRAPIPAACQRCGGRLLDAVGAGTEKVAELLARHYPDLEVAILDRDTVRRKDGLQHSLGAFAAGKVRVLVGTQMVAKGHHFPDVTLTGVISADALLGLPDFRSAERTFQLLTQLAGRSGRGRRPGRVIIQTYYPDHPAVRHAASHDVASFLDEELHFRAAFGYPPNTRMAVVRYESGDRLAASAAATAAGRAAAPLPPGVRLRGPAPAPIERIRGSWRWQLLLTAPNRELLREVLERIEASPPPRSVRSVVDVDPLSTL